MSTMKIEIKSWFDGSVLFRHEAKNNSIKLTVEAAVKVGANLYRANLHEANLHEANLYRANLYGATLYGANLHNAILVGANLHEAILVGANLHGANLHNAILYGASLHEANLHEANLYGASLDGAILDGASYGENIPLTRIPLHLLKLKWPILILDTHIKIGCELHPTEKWAAFSDEKIASMEPNALEFWKKYKDLILAAAKKHQMAGKQKKGR